MNAVALPFLSKQEQADLAALEEIIDQGIDSFDATGRALQEICERKLYRATYNNFPAYLKGRWKFGSRYAYNIIASAKTLAALKIEDKKGGMSCSQDHDVRHARGEITERHMRALRGLPAEIQQQAWQQATKEARGTPTVQQVREAVKEIKAETEEEEPEERTYNQRHEEKIRESEEAIKGAARWLRPSRMEEYRQFIAGCGEGIRKAVRNAKKALSAGKGMRTNADLEDLEDFILRGEEMIRLAARLENRL
ncbi:MAG: hypothetical protein KGL39_42900 [Patescibacteria group bacterium]|nr:hypothetical protein [Patescibacteria group bacterium]